MTAGETSPPALSLAFAPVHKFALGVASGIVAALLIFGLAVFHIVLQPANAANIQLLDQYFYGFDNTWPGAFIGLGWGFLTGFVIGWFVAFVRNLVVTVAVFALRTKAELTQTSDFLDHI